MIDNYDIEVKLLGITDLSASGKQWVKSGNNPPSERLIEYAGRLCWDTVDRMNTNPDRIQEWIELGHESVLEHGSATFYIKASRVLTHELVRHRIASYSQRSQRYVKEAEIKYVMPAEILAMGKDAKLLFENAMHEAWSTYGRLLKLGLKAEIARYVLPNGCETQIVMTMNFRELRHFIKLRTSEKALPEMRAVAGEVRRIMKQQVPQVFADI